MLGGMEIKDLTPNPKNPRTTTEPKLAMLKKSLAEFGDLGGFVFNRKTGQMVGGHQRAKAFDSRAKIILEKKYPKATRTGTVAEGFVEFKGERFKYREVAWDEVREKAANIAANKGAGEWDLPELSNWLQDISDFGFDLDLTMFDESERLAAMVLNEEAVVLDLKDDEVPAPPRVAKSKKGELYILGNHRLLCGDSTSLEDLERLTVGHQVDVTFTSPPYNGGNLKFKGTGNDGKLYESYKDDLPSDEYVRFASDVLANCIAYTKKFVFWNVNYNSNSRCEFIKQIVPHLALLEETLCWWKKTALPVPSGLTRTWEPIFVFRGVDQEKRLGHLNVTEFNHWEFSSLNALHESHRAAFPVELPLKALELVENASSVLDPFGGSGTTMIAAEKAGKQCFMIELDPIYVDVIIARWEKFTGKKAQLDKPFVKVRK